MPGHAHDTFQVVRPGYRGLGDQESQVRAGDGSDDGAADARRAVYQQVVGVLLHSGQARPALDQRHQLARVLSSGEEMSVEERPVAGLRAKPSPIHPLLHLDGLHRALIEAGGAALAAYLIHGVCLIASDDGLKAADLSADIAGGAQLRINNRYPAACELTLLLDLRRQHQLQVGSIHIGVGQDD